MKFLITAFLLTVSCFTLAGEFGPVTLQGLTYGNDQSDCEAEDIIKDEYARTGVDFVEGKANLIWTCEEVTPPTAEERRCPYPQYLPEGSGVPKCFANSKDGLAVCVVDPSHEMIEEKYHMQDPKMIARSRFKAIFVLGKGTHGYREDRSIMMDKKGCLVQSTLSDNPWKGTEGADFEKCSKMLDRIMQGGEREYTENSTKYCDTSKGKDPRYISEVIDDIAYVGTCMRAIPNFEARYKQHLEQITTKIDVSDKAKAKVK